MLRIWEKHFYKEIFKVFFLFLFVFYGLYTLIDYTSHVVVLATSIVIFVGASFSCTISVNLWCAQKFYAFALLIATVKVLCQLNQHNELIALLAAGYSKRRLLAPFLYSALLITVLLFLSSEFILPRPTSAATLRQQIQEG